MGNVRQLAALSGVIISLTNAVALPPSVRAALLAASGVLLSVEHIIDGSASGTQSATPSGAGTLANGSSQSAGQA